MSQARLSILRKIKVSIPTANDCRLLAYSVEKLCSQGRRKNPSPSGKLDLF
jgi:hypothetical protein